MQITYDSDVDALHLTFRPASGPVANREVSPGIYHLIDAKNRLVGFEVLGASVHLGKAALANIDAPPIDWLTLAEAEAEARSDGSPIQAVTLRRLVAAGRLEGRKVGATWQVSGTALSNYLLNRPKRGPKPATRKRAKRARQLA